jgi:hypothetical protein
LFGPARVAWVFSGSDDQEHETTREISIPPIIATAGERLARL